MKKLLYFLILFGMGASGVFCLAWFLTPPNPDRVGFWYIIFFVIHPFLAALGMVSLVLKKSLNLSWWLGIVLLLFVGGLGLLMVLLGNGLNLFTNFSFEVLYSFVWTPFKNLLISDKTSIRVAGSGHR